MDVFTLIVIGAIAYLAVGIYISFGLHQMARGLSHGQRHRLTAREWIWSRSALTLLHLMVVIFWPFVVLKIALEVNS